MFFVVTQRVKVLLGTGTDAVPMMHFTCSKLQTILITKKCLSFSITFVAPVCVCLSISVNMLRH